MKEKSLVVADPVITLITEAFGDTQDDLELFLKENYEFLFNVVTGRLLFKPADGGVFKEMDEYDFNTILRQLSRTQISCSFGVLKQLLVSDFTVKFDPFIEYLKNLPLYKAGGTDFIDEWADTVQANNQVLWKKCFRKWIVALVGSLKDEKTVNHTALIFCGKQGVGKTKWIETLLPAELKGYYFSGTINTSNKDSVTQLSECALINMDELENMGKESIGDLKSLMTKGNIRIRRPYGRVAENLPRRASFIGSINRKNFLNDETGSRRFLCFDVMKMEYGHTLEVRNLFAQALHLYNSGFKYWFDDAEIEEVQNNNQVFRTTTREEEILLKYFEPCNVEDATHLFNTTSLGQFLTKKEKIALSSHSAIQHLGKALVANKFSRLKKDGVYVWALKTKQVAGFKGKVTR